LTAVQADIKTYLKWYKVNGFFFDEVQADSAHEAYYNSLATFVRGLNQNFLVVLNPGTIPAVQSYLGFADLVVIKEDYISTSPSFQVKLLHQVETKL
jgi:hypothetical protein